MPAPRDLGRTGTPCFHFNYASKPTLSKYSSLALLVFACNDKYMMLRYNIIQRYIYIYNIHNYTLYIYMQHIFRMCQPLPYFSKTSWCNGAQVLPTFRSQISPFLYMAVSGNGVCPQWHFRKWWWHQDHQVMKQLTYMKVRFLFNSFGICYVLDPERDRNALGSTMTRWVFKFGSQGHAVPEGAIPLELFESWLPRISSE